MIEFLKTKETNKIPEPSESLLRRFCLTGTKKPLKKEVMLLVVIGKMERKIVENRD